MLAPTIVFDLDGTLVDTAPDLIDTLNFVFAREGIPPVAYDVARTMIGGGARRMIERGLSDRGVAVAAADAERLYKDFVAHYAEHIADRSRPFPGLEAALERLAGEGARLAVCTNKLEWLSVRLLEQLGLAKQFSAVCGQDTFGLQKPDPLMLRLTVERAGGRLDRAVMVGDSATDVTTARAAGVPAIVVDFGYEEVPVAQLKPDRIISHFRDLPEVVAGVLAAPQASRA
jgi:phosphoglycolate phosphatase